ncbi:MAG: hypothetical protein IT178_12830 [Acidobacteria bacterium]|nr:hypothetical protein [Acidobacteriota bacterium]
MTWQDAGVIVIVGAAVVYLVRKFTTRPPRRTMPDAFITLDKVKRRKT